jgi:hypothetical protein
MLHFRLQLLLIPVAVDEACATVRRAADGKFWNLAGSLRRTTTYLYCGLRRGASTVVRLSYALLNVSSAGLPGTAGDLVQAVRARFWRHRAGSVADGHSDVWAE